MPTTIGRRACAAAPHTQRRTGVTLLAATLCLLVALGLRLPRSTAAHPELVRASPPPDGLLAAPPQQLDLWVSEAVDAGAGSPSLLLLDETGHAVPVRAAVLDPADPTHVRADVAGLGTGTYTVSWSARSAIDGHTLSGTYAFRVGGGRAPGAATVQGESPQPWGVATRWLTFLGAAVAGGGFLFARILLGGNDPGDRTGRRRNAVIAGGALLALLATFAEPVLQTRWPPAGTLAPTLTEAVAGLPQAWWLRPAALTPVLLLGLALLLRRRVGGRLVLAAESAGLALALVALLGLSLTSHAAARADWRALAVGSNVLHQWAIALWVGGLAHLALAWSVAQRPDTLGLEGPTPEGSPAPLDPLRRFSRLALGLVVVGIATGVVNAGLLLPTIRSLWTSPYGDILLLKVAALVPPLALATFHRVALRRVATRLRSALRTTVRVEVALVLLVVLGGSVLALLAPPVVQAARPLDLAAPTGGGDLLVHLGVQPAKPGENTLTVFVTDAQGAPVSLDQAARVGLDLTSLEHPVEIDAVEAQPNGTGRYEVAGMPLSLEGWWRIGVTVRRAEQPNLQAPFYLRLPDPNVSVERITTPPSSPEAEAVFQRGLASLTSLHSVRYRRTLASGTGTVFASEEAISVGDDGHPPAYAVSSSGVDLIRVGDREWLRSPDGVWRDRPASPFVPPAAWGEEFESATGFRLGRVEEVGGEPAQIVTFVVPGTPRQAAAWYAWWVDLERGRILRQAMVSRWHYMVLEYHDFDAPIAIDPPTPAPAATPAATPVALVTALLRPDLPRSPKRNHRPPAALDVAVTFPNTQRIQHP